LFNAVESKDQENIDHNKGIKMGLHQLIEKSELSGIVKFFLLWKI
jgi:hypothetical protein